MERVTRAILSSEDGGVPLSRFEGDYRRMTKTQFPWKDYDFKSARDMLISMEKAVEFKFNDKEGQFYLLPVHVTITSSGTLEDASARVTESKHIDNARSRVQHSSSSSSSCQSANTDTTADGRMPSLVDTSSDLTDDMFTVDQYGRVSVYVAQSKEKAAMNYWNVRIMFCIANSFMHLLKIILIEGSDTRVWDSTTVDFMPLGSTCGFCT